MIASARDHSRPECTTFLLSPYPFKADLEAVAFQVYLYTCIFYLTNMRMSFVRRYTRFSIFDLGLGPGPGPSPTASNIKVGLY